MKNKTPGGQQKLNTNQLTNDRGSEYGTIVNLGIVQTTVVVFMILGYFFINTTGLGALAIMTFMFLAIILSIGALISIGNLYLTIVYLVDKKPEGSIRSTVTLFCTVSIGILLLAIWVGVAMVGSSLFPI